MFFSSFMFSAPLSFAISSCVPFSSLICVCFYISVFIGGKKSRFPDCNDLIDDVEPDGTRQKQDKQYADRTEKR